MEFTTESITKKKEFLMKTIEYLDKRRFMFEELWEEITGSSYDGDKQLEKSNKVFALEQCYALVIEDLQKVDRNLTVIFNNILLDKPLPEEKE